MIRLTHHGLREMLVGTLVLVVIGAVLGYFVWWPLGLVVVPVLVWLFAFFRDPQRPVPDEPNVMVSPADGVVSDITEIPHDDLLGGPAIRVGIFLSVFNVHINRSPCEARVLATYYKQGKFINAMKHNEASSQNESNTIVLGEPAGDRPIAVVKQIVGLIARRIVCTATKDDTLQRGQRIGMIKFGSRTELTIAKWMEPVIRVRIGQPVRGAQDIIAALGHPAADDASAAAPVQQAGSTGSPASA